MSTWRILFWKELEEQKWKLLSLVLIVLSVLVSQLISGDLEIGLTLVVAGFVLAGPVFVGMGVSSAEHGSGAISFVRSLPAPTWQSGFARVVVGWFVLIAPLVVALLVSLCGVVVAADSVRDSESAPKMILLVVGIGIASATNVYAWVLLATMNQKSELRAGLIGLVTVVVLCYVSLLAAEYNYRHRDDAGINAADLFLSIGPLAGFWSHGPGVRSAVPWPFVCVVQLCTVGVLCLCAIGNYGKRTLLSIPALRRNPERDGRASIPLKRPMSSPNMALAWMQLRESAPIALCGVLLMALIAGINVNGATYYIIRDLGPFVGCILAFIIGVGSFVPPLQPELHTFWRSRPISPRKWFWLKYLAGAAVLVCCYNLPIVVLQRLSLVYLAYWDARYHPVYSTVSSFWFPVVLHLFVYSSVVLTSCSVRHGIYSAVLGVGIVLLVIVPPETIPGFPAQLSFLQLWRETTSIALNLADSFAYFLNGCLLLGPFIVGCTLFSAWLIRKDVSVAT